MSEQELVCIHQRPVDVFPRGAFVRRLANVPQRRLRFCCSRRSRERGQEQLCQDLAVGRLPREELADAVVGRTDLAEDELAVLHLEGAGQVDVALPLALAGRLAGRLAEGLEERM